MKPISTFASQVSAKVTFNPEFVVEKNNCYYLLNSRVKKIVQSDFFYAGVYLGKVKDSFFFPSFNLLNMLVPTAVNKIFLERKAAWLFICGRDILSKGILNVHGAKHKGTFTLVINEFGECLGIGEIIENLYVSKNKVVVKNVLDVGDFLRRER